MSGSLGRARWPGITWLLITRRPWFWARPQPGTAVANQAHAQALVLAVAGLHPRPAYRYSPNWPSKPATRLPTLHRDLNEDQGYGRITHAFSCDLDTLLILKAPRKTVYAPSHVSIPYGFALHSKDARP